MWLVGLKVANTTTTTTTSPHSYTHTVQAPLRCTTYQSGADSYLVLSTGLSYDDVQSSEAFSVFVGMMHIILVSYIRTATLFCFAFRFASRVRMDYLRPYSLAHPVHSFTVLSKEPEPQYGYEDSPPAPEGTTWTCGHRRYRISLVVP